MRPQVIIVHLSIGLTLAALVGLFRRQRHRACYSFTVYLLSVAVFTMLITWWPQRFYWRPFWLFKEGVYSVLKSIVAFELALRTFRSFPGARATARRVLLLVLALTFGAVAAIPDNNPDFPLLAGKLLPRIVNGTIWLFTAIAALILWYRLPVDPFQKAILMGFVPWLLLFNTLLHIEDLHGWQLTPYFNALSPIAYMALLGYWTWAAWQPAGVPVRPGRATNDAPRLVQST
jgi:hypothetical protein